MSKWANEKFVRAVGLTLGLTLALMVGSQRRPGPVSHEELALRYGPIIYQGAATSKDYITALDFDGDWIGNNNWENQPTGDMTAYVYYSVIESETHWFIFYSLFHPRDYIQWGDCATEGGCHENDMESIQLVVEKDGTTFGRLVVMETLAHGDIYLYTLDDDDSVAAGYLRRDGVIRQEQGHPKIFVEVAGHGIRGRPVPSFGGQVIYRAGREAQIPDDRMDEPVAYELTPIYTSLWARRNDVGDGHTFDGPFNYRGRTLPAAIDGADFGVDRANTPWGYDQASGERLTRGDWFLDPAKALAYHADFASDFSLDYVYNPYLDDLGLSEP
jgi:hypothetical protein